MRYLADLRMERRGREASKEEVLGNEPSPRGRTGEPAILLTPRHELCEYQVVSLETQARGSAGVCVLDPDEPRFPPAVSGPTP